MTRDQLRLTTLLEHATGDTALLACNHTQPLPLLPKRTRDGWYAAIWCDTCQKRRAVVTVIWTKEPAA